MNLDVLEYAAKMDEENNPPLQPPEYLTAHVFVAFKNQTRGSHYRLRLKVPLKELREGTLTSLSVEYES